MHPPKYNLCHNLLTIQGFEVHHLLCPIFGPNVEVMNFLQSPCAVPKPPLSLSKTFTHPQAHTQTQHSSSTRPTRLRKWASVHQVWTTCAPRWEVAQSSLFAGRHLQQQMKFGTSPRFLRIRSSEHDPRTPPPQEMRP